MKPVIKDIREITDSKEMYETKPNPFIKIFIYILVACIGCALIWMYWGEVDIVSKGLGVVRPSENISNIRSKAQGEVIYTQVEEGKQVQKGDVLFELAYDDLEIQKLAIMEALKEKKNTLQSLEKLRDSIEQEKNLFSLAVEKEYYDRYIKFENDYKVLKNDMLISSENEESTTRQTEINRSIYIDELAKQEEEILNLKTLKDCFLQGKNLFKDNKAYYALEWQTYTLNRQGLESTLNDRKSTHDKNTILAEEGIIPKAELKESKLALEMVQNELETLEINQIKHIEERIKNAEAKKEIARQEVSKLETNEESLIISERQRNLNIEKYKTDILVPLYNQIDELSLQYKTTQKELESIELGIENCQVIAPIEGTISVIQDINEGDLILAGTDIATIIPQEDSLYKIEIFIPNREIAGIKVGDAIKYKFDALPYKEYGEFAGVISNISTDAKVNKNLGISGYYVQGSIENKVIYSYKNKPAQIKVGMSAEAHIVTNQKKIINYLLEKINLRD